MINGNFVLVISYKEIEGPFEIVFLFFLWSHLKSHSKNLGKMAH